MYRDLLHLCHAVALGLAGRHKASRPGRCIFYERARKGHSALVGIAYCVGSSGIGNAAYIVEAVRKAAGHIPFSHNAAVAVAHHFDAYALVGC